MRYFGENYGHYDSAIFILRWWENFRFDIPYAKREPLQALFLYKGISVYFLAGGVSLGFMLSFQTSFDSPTSAAVVLVENSSLGAGLAAGGVVF